MLALPDRTRAVQPCALSEFAQVAACFAHELARWSKHSGRRSIDTTADTRYVTALGPTRRMLRHMKIKVGAEPWQAECADENAFRAAGYACNVLSGASVLLAPKIP